MLEKPRWIHLSFLPEPTSELLELVQTHYLFVVVLPDLEQSLIIDEVESFQHRSDARFNNFPNAEREQCEEDVKQAVHAHESNRVILK
jgi:hypothetical protein